MLVGRLRVAAGARQNWLSGHAQTDFRSRQGFVDCLFREEFRVFWMASSPLTKTPFGFCVCMGNNSIAPAAKLLFASVGAEVPVSGTFGAAAGKDCVCCSLAPVVAEVAAASWPPPAESEVVARLRRSRTDSIGDIFPFEPEMGR